MSDRQVVALAVATVLGALAARDVPVAAGAVLCAVGALWRRQPHRVGLVIVGVGLLGSALAAGAVAGLGAPPTQAVHGAWVTLLSDPAPNSFGSIGVDVRIGRRHAQAFAHGPAGDALMRRLAGERVRVDGRLAPVTGRSRAWLVSKHIATRLTIDAITGARKANVVGAAANAYRRLVARGARTLPEQLRPLFGGMVLGDDRGQSPAMQDAFRAAGLTHLLVVSGQNVAFALLVAAPLLKRGRLWWRLVATCAVLAAFGTLTRWEPSVLRAEAMAAVAAVATFAGRPVPVVRLLALAVTACVLVDPLLVHSVGFRLSVAACAGLAVLTPVFTRRGVPTLVAASLAAQIGAAVVLVPTFGTVPLVALPANVLAVPLAGPIMMWGLTAGPIAGWLSPLAGVIHLPTRVALAWVAGVATHAAALPIAPIGPAAALAVAFAAVVLVVTRRHAVSVTAFGATLAVVVVLALRGPSASLDRSLGSGARLWVVGGRSVVAVGGPVASDALQTLRALRVHRLDVLVVTRPGAGAAGNAAPLIAAFRPRLILGPEHHQVANAHTARAGAVVRVGGLTLRVSDAGPPLRVRVTPTHYVQARDPPPRRPPRRHHAPEPRDGDPQPYARLVLRPG